MYKKSLIIIGVILVIAVGLYIYSNNRIVEKEEAISENIEKTSSIDNIIKKLLQN